VDIAHLEAKDERRASLEIVLVDADVHLPVDKRLQDRHVRVPQNIQNRNWTHMRSSLVETPEPLQMILKRDRRSQTKAPEWRNGLALTTKSRRKQENAPTGILTGLLEFDFPGKVHNPPAQRAGEQDLLARTI
jgi:metallophosphoesterase superfamily enzyme